MTAVFPFSKRYRVTQAASRRPPLGMCTTVTTSLYFDFSRFLDARSSSQVGFEITKVLHFPEVVCFSQFWQSCSRELLSLSSDKTRLGGNALVFSAFLVTFSTGWFAKVVRQRRHWDEGSFLLPSDVHFTPAIQGIDEENARVCTDVKYIMFFPNLSPSLLCQMLNKRERNLLIHVKFF